MQFMKGVPHTLVTTECPMRWLKDPRVEEYLALFFRWKRFGLGMPLDDLPNRDVMALESMDHSMKTHRLPEEK